MVFAGGPADLAGMLAGDHVLAVDGDDVRDLSHMKVSLSPNPVYCLHINSHTIVNSMLHVDGPTLL